MKYRSFICRECKTITELEKPEVGHLCDECSAWTIPGIGGALRLAKKSGYVKRKILVAPKQGKE